MDILPENLN